MLIRQMFNVSFAFSFGRVCNSRLNQLPIAIVLTSLKRGADGTICHSGLYVSRFMVNSSRRGVRFLNDVKIASTKRVWQLIRNVSEPT